MAVAIAAALFGFPLHGAVLRNDTPNNAFWRVPRNDGINCLYLQLRLLNRTISYEKLVSMAGKLPQRNTLSQLADIAAEFDVTMMPQRLTFEQLRTSNVPLIAAMEPDGVGSGTFALPYAASSSQVDYVEGSTVRVLQVSADEFRRSWTGYALVPQHSVSLQENFIRYLAVPLTTYVVVIFGTYIHRRFKNRRVVNSHGRDQTIDPLMKILISSAVIAIALGSSQCSFGSTTGPTTIPSNIRDALSKNAQQLDGLSVTWTQQLQPVVSQSEAISQFKITTPLQTLFAKRDQRITVHNGLIYYRLEQFFAGKGGSDVLEHAFDGTVLYLGRPDEKTSDGSPTAGLAKLGVARLAQERPQETWIDAAYLRVAGFWLPSTSLDLKSRSPLTSLILRMLDVDSATLVSIDPGTSNGQEVVKLRIDAEDPDAAEARAADPKQAEKEWRDALLSEEEIRKQLAALERQRNLPKLRRHYFYLDPRTAFSVCKHEERDANEKLLVETAFDSFEQLQARTLWLPKKVVVQYFSWPTAGGFVAEKPLLTDRYELRSVDTTPPEPKLFRLNYTVAGTTVQERLSGKPDVVYKIPASKSELKAALERAQVNDKQWVGSQSSWRGQGLIAAGAALVAASVLLWWMGHRAKIRDVNAKPDDSHEQS